MIQGPIRKPGVELSLYRACLLIAQRAKGLGPVKPWLDREVVDQVVRAAQTPTTMADAPDIVQVMDEFVEALVENSAAAALINLATNRTFGRAGVVAIHELSELPQADWIAEGAPMPVVMGLSALTTMVPYKIGTIVALTNEMMASASAEAIIRQKLVDNVGPALDRSLFSAAPGVPGLRPPGLLNGLTALTPPAATSPSEQMIVDVEALIDALAAYGGNGQIALISSVKQSVRLKKFTVGESGYPVFVTNAVTNTLIAVATRALAVGVDPPSIEASDAGTFHMNDVPLPLDGLVASPVRSAWQTDSVTLRFRLPVSWALRAPAVAFVTPSW
jgi:hypothetical protein